MKYDVFISYSSLDQKVAEGVCAYLEQHHIRCFIAYRDIPKGIAWAEYIVEALDESRMMVVVFSKNANRSKQVGREIALASEDHKPILTFRISNEDFKGVKKYYLKNLNWIDAFPQPEKCFGALCENAKLLLGLGNIQLIDKITNGKSYTKEFDKNQSDYKSQSNLETCDKEESSIDENLKQAVYWYRKAAEQGNAKAQCNLGVCYRNGEGVERNLEQAVYWYRKAAEQGYARAQCNLGVCYKNGEGVERNLEQAVYWYQKAAEQGYTRAQCNLGVCYRNGEGVERDLEQAVYWYQKAAEQGYAKAQCNLAYIIKEME